MSLRWPPILLSICPDNAPPASQKCINQNLQVDAIVSIHIKLDIDRDIDDGKYFIIVFIRAKFSLLPSPDCNCLHLLLRNLALQKESENMAAVIGLLFCFVGQIQGYFSLG